MTKTQTNKESGAEMGTLQLCELRGCSSRPDLSSAIPWPLLRHSSGSMVRSKSIVGGQLEGIWKKLSEFREQGMSLESVRDPGVISTWEEKRKCRLCQKLSETRVNAHWLEGRAHGSQAPGPTEVIHTLEMCEPWSRCFWGLRWVGKQTEASNSHSYRLQIQTKCVCGLCLASQKGDRNNIIIYFKVFEILYMYKTKMWSYHTIYTSNSPQDIPSTYPSFKFVSLFFF